MPAQSVRIAAVQMDPKLGDIAANRRAILQHLGEAAKNGASLVAFPECALTGYGFASRVEALASAEPIPGQSVALIAQACATLGTFCVFGLLEADGDRLFNACVLVGPEGLVGSYRKIHLPFVGVDRFADPGDRPFAVHEANGLRIGMHICYDGAFPESARVLTLLGADLLILPTNWPTHSETAAEHMMSCRALENVVYTMAVDRVGVESGFEFIGRSSITDTAGNRLAFASVDREEILYADIEPAKARAKKLIRRPGLHEVDRIGDRRPSFYDLICEPNGRA